MKRLDKKDFLNSLFLTIFFIIFVIIVTKFKFYFGSTLDWEAQHITFPDYFRTLFYENKDLLPDFALNIGGGQNIYNFSYYGLLSPIILISYLFPSVKMIDYIVISSIVCVVSSAILFYSWLRTSCKGNYGFSFIASFAFLFAVSLSFHSHRHVMFINYMPFMVLGLFGVDKKLLRNKSWLLSISVFLMIMTSYYYSVSGIMCLIVYGVYKYIKINKDITFKKFMRDGFKFILPILIGILCSAIIILPTFYVILNGRGETFNSISLKDLFMPNLNVKYVLYGSYGIGLTAIYILSIINLFFKKRENIFLGICLSLMIVFPIFNYILNATMYIDSKILIPWLPLAVYSIYLFISDLSNINKKYFWIFVSIISFLVFFQGDIWKAYFVDLIILLFFFFLYKYSGKFVFLAILCILIPFSAAIIASSTDSLVSYKSKNKEESESKEIINSVTSSDSAMYRISNLKKYGDNMNNIFRNINYYNSTLYSSTYNKGYNRFYYDVINNSIPTRNRVITSASNNLMFLMFSGNKYLISDNSLQGFEFYKEVMGQKIFKSDDVLPMFYARSDSMASSLFDELGYPYQSEALLNYVVADDGVENNFKSNIKKTNFNVDEFTFENLNMKIDNNRYVIDAKKGARGYYKLKEENVNKILFIRFKMDNNPSCTDGDIYIKINGIKNKLTCKEWKYHNQNFEYDYVIADDDLKDLKIEFSKGTHVIKDFKAYSLDYGFIKNVKSNVDEFNVDPNKTKGDVIEGNIEVSNDGYFVTSIPYDKGFNVRVDGNIVEVLNINKGFIGFKIDKGYHHVHVEYKSPMKNIAIVCSIIGFVLLLGVIFFEKRAVIKK